MTINKTPNESASKTESDSDSASMPETSSSATEKTGSKSASKTGLKSAVQSGWSKLGILLVGFVLGALLFSGDSDTEPHEVHSDHRVDSHAEAETEFWTCAMHPQIRQPEAGLCPICGMDLIPVASGDQEDSSHPRRVVLSKRAQALAKLQTVELRRRDDASAQLRLLGRIEANETTLKTITAWTGGRIDRLHVKATGERVRKGQVVATLYSPEVFAAHQDLIVAKRQVKRMAQSPESSRLAAAAALNASRDRLRLLGVPDDELARMENKERPTRAVAMRSPFSGTVIERKTTEGVYVSIGTPLYRLANLSTLWVQLDAYESDLAGISLKDTVLVRVDALPGQQFSGKVAFIDPTVDPRSRTAKVRVVVDDADGQLRPGMFAEATVETGKASPAKSKSRRAKKKGKGATKELAETQEESRPLVVPATAPLFTGRRAIVYVEVEHEGRIAYEARTVRLGPRLGDDYPVVAGLSEGERVVRRGAFALDADLQIRGGASMMSSPDDRSHGPWDAVIELPSSERAKLAPVLNAYLNIQQALAADSFEAAQAGAQQLLAAIAKVQLKQALEAQREWNTRSRALEQHGKSLKTSTSIEAARQAFESLSGEVQAFLARFGNPLDTPLHLAFCPMASGSEGASWIQGSKEIDNAYFGAAMRSCGEVQQVVPPGSYLRVSEGGSN